MGKSSSKLQKGEKMDEDAIRLSRGNQPPVVKIPDDTAHRKHAETLLRIDRDLAIAFCSASKLDEALQRVLEAVCKMEAVDGGGVYLVNTQTKRLELTAHKGLPSFFIQAVAKYEPDAPQAWMVNEGKPLFGLLSQIAPVMDDVRRAAGLRASAVLPLKNDGQVVGVLNVASRTHDELPSSTSNALEAIAAQAAGVIARLRAEKALRQSHASLEERVKKRTAELEEANKRLRAEMAERELVESALRISEERFRLAFEESPLGKAIIDIEGKCLQVNRAICRMFDREPSRIVGESVAGLGFSNFSQYTSDELRRVTAGEIPNFTWESEFARGNGETVWARITATAVHDQNGKLLCGLGMVEDITQRKTAELALRRSEELFRLAFEESPLGMVIVDTKGKCRQVNRTFAQMLGYLPEELHGKSLVELTHPGDRKTQADYLNRLLSGTCRRYTLEKRYLQKDGQAIWTRLTVDAVYDQDGMWLYGLGMVEDINKRKEAERALRHAERLASIGTLAAGIAHEINNPLGAIVLSADAALLASEQRQGDEIVKASLRNIQAGALRCGRIVKSVLQFSRNEVSQKWLEDIGEVVRRARDITKRLADDAGVAVRLEIDGDLPRVVINPTEIEQVLVNMITNAVQASKPDGCVNVGADRRGNNLIIAIEDRGVGMTKKQSERIFDPFYTTRQSTGGTGLGLSISHGIVQEHGGEIHFKSEPGTGTKMTVMLPVSRRQDKPIY